MKAGNNSFLSPELHCNFVCLQTCYPEAQGAQLCRFMFSRREKQTEIHLVLFGMNFWKFQGKISILCSIIRNSGIVQATYLHISIFPPLWSQQLLVIFPPFNWKIPKCVQFRVKAGQHHWLSHNAENTGICREGINKSVLFFFSNLNYYFSCSDIYNSPRHAPKWSRKSSSPARNSARLWRHIGAQKTGRHVDGVLI